MRLLAAAFLSLHGLIHLLGVAKAFGWAELPQLVQPISPARGVFWGLAALLFVAAAACIYFWPRGWWVIGAVAIAISTVLVAAAWSEARFGAAANVLALLMVVFGYLTYGPGSLRAQFDRDVADGLGRTSASSTDAVPRDGRGTITEADLAPLPAPVQRYLRLAGAVGQPRVVSVRARMHGRIRSGPGARWMPFVAEQYDFFDRPSRFFYMNASMFFIPAQGYHRYAGSEATMVVKAAAVVPVARQAGPSMTRTETVTLFNDMCLLAPATLIDPAIVWEPVDDWTARATFSNAAQTIRAELLFNEQGELVDFRSDDRGQSSTDGRTLISMRWSTPVGNYRRYGAATLASVGEGRWHPAEGDYTYIELTIDEVEYNTGDK
jgi:hypothetical protein